MYKEGSLVRNYTNHLILILLLVVSWIGFIFIFSPDSSITGEAIDDSQVSAPSKDIIVYEPEYSVVTRVIDGDTIEIENGERVRLVCMDAPELGEDCYREAKERLEELVLDEKVKLVRDVSDRGKYGRLVRYVYKIDGTFVDELMVREGYAIAYPYSPDITLCPQIEKAEEYAKENNLGKWSGCEPRKEIDDDCSSNKYNCEDFRKQVEAQAVFDLCLDDVGYDVHGLDGDKDGVACEALS